MNNEEQVEPYANYEPVIEPIAVESIVVEPAPVYVEPVEPTVFVTPEVVAEPEVVAPAEVKAKSKKSAVAAPDTFADDDIVFLSSLKFKAVSRNSRSVYLVQERLYQLGFDGGYEDQPGWLSDGTRRALAEFCPCDESSVRVDDAELIKRLFSGTSVRVVE
jgi:hypothetical protein